MKLTDEQFRAILERPAIRAANPALGGVESSQQPKPPRALERNAQAKQSRERSLAVCVQIIGLRRRRLDDDNFAAGAKPLRDAIAASLAIDDGASAIRFEYAQAQTEGPEGTIVRIAWL